VLKWSMHMIKAHPFGSILLGSYLAVALLAAIGTWRLDKKKDTLGLVSAWESLSKFELDRPHLMHHMRKSALKRRSISPERTTFDSVVEPKPAEAEVVKTSDKNTGGRACRAGLMTHIIMSSVSNRHPWLSIIFRPPESNFTSTDRLFFLFAQLLLQATLSASFFHQALHTEDGVTFSFGTVTYINDQLHQFGDQENIDKFKIVVWTTIVSLGFTTIVMWGLSPSMKRFNSVILGVIEDVYSSSTAENLKSPEPRHNMPKLMLRYLTERNSLKPGRFRWRYRLVLVLMRLRFQDQRPAGIDFHTSRWRALRQFGFTAVNGSISFAQVESAWAQRKKYGDKKICAYVFLFCLNTIFFWILATYAVSLRLCSFQFVA
jgi:hypothetical protein